MIELKPIIEDIIIPEKELAELNRIMNSSYYRHTKTEALRKIAGGKCCVCYGVPSKKVIYDLSDEDGKALKIEYYCDKHLTRLTATNGLDHTIAVKGRKSSQKDN